MKIIQRMKKINYQIFDYLHRTSNKKIMSTILSVALLTTLSLFSLDMINIQYGSIIVFVVLLALAIVVVFVPEQRTEHPMFYQKHRIIFLSKKPYCSKHNTIF